MNIKEKLSNIDNLIIKNDFLKKLIIKSERNYQIDDLVNLWYVSVIKKWEIYFNNMIKSFKDPYILWWAYMDFNDFAFAWADMYNKKWFTTQISNIFTIYNLKYSRELKIVWLKFKFKKVKKEFMYWLESKMINWYTIKYMTKERLFLEYVRDYINYKEDFFIDIYKKLDEKILEKYLKKYPIKKVVLKVNKIKECI